MRTRLGALYLESTDPPVEGLVAILGRKCYDPAPAIALGWVVTEHRHGAPYEGGSNPGGHRDVLRLEKVGVMTPAEAFLEARSLQVAMDVGSHGYQCVALGWRDLQGRVLNVA